MEFWIKLSKALEQKGFSIAQIKKLQELFGSLTGTELLNLPPEKVLPAMTGRTVGEKREKIEILFNVLREMLQDQDPERTDQDISRISIDNTRLGRFFNERKTELQKNRISNTRDLRELARYSDARLRELGFDNNDQKILRSIRDLARVFPPEVATALNEKGASTLNDILKWSMERFMSAVEPFGLMPDKVRFEYARLERLVELSREGADMSRITGIEVDLARGTSVPDNDKNLLLKYGIETLEDWVVSKEKINVSPDTAKLLDSFSRLYAVGVHGEPAERFRKDGIDSAIALARLGSDAALEKARQLGMKADDMIGIISRARDRTTRTINLIDVIMTPVDGKLPDWIKDIIGGFANNKCVECDDENSAFSGFAYFIYLIQRTGKTPDELEKQIIDKHQLRTVLQEIYRKVHAGSNITEPLPEGFFIRHLSPVIGSFEIPDPLQNCGSITLIELLTRHLEEYLDKLRTGALALSERSSYVYLKYETWRGERLAYYFPELAALWQDNVFTSKDIPETRGSILLNRESERSVIAQQLAGVREALKEASLKQGSSTYQFEDDIYHKEFLRGLTIIEEILAIDDTVRKATDRLDEGQPGLALEELYQALSALDSISGQVFPKDSLWRLENMSTVNYYTRLSDLAAIYRKDLVRNAFNALMGNHRKLIFEPMESLPVAGLRTDGSINLSHDAWIRHSAYKETTEGFKIESQASGSALRRIRYNPSYGNEFQDYMIHFDFERANGETFPYQPDFGIGVVVRRQDSGAGYRFKIVVTVSGDNDSGISGYAHDLVLERLNDSGQAFVLKTARIGTEAYIDIEGKHIVPNHVYRFGIHVSGSLLRGRIVKSPTSFVEITAQDTMFSKGTFAIEVHKNLSVNFTNFEAKLESTTGLCPFFAPNRQSGPNIIPKMSLGSDVYYRHVAHGHGMSNKLMALPLVRVAEKETEIELIGAKRADKKLYLVFKTGRMKVDNQALDYLLERCLAGLFFLRYAVIPIRMAQALGFGGDYENAVKLLHLLYDETVPGEEKQRYIYPEFAAPPDPLGRSISPDAQLLRLRLADLYLEWAEWLFRQDTPGSRHQARRLYEAVMVLHGNADCNCEAQLGTVIETILDRWLELLPDRPEKPDLLDKPGRYNDVFDSIIPHWDKLPPEKLLELIKNRDPGNIDPSPETFGNLVNRVKDYVNEVKGDYNVYINETKPFEEVMKRGDQLIVNAESRGWLDNHNDPVRGLAEGASPGSSTSGFFLRRSFPTHPGNQGTQAKNLQWQYGEFQFPAFCVSPNPLRSQQIKTACLMLDLINNCRNILGFDNSFVPPLRFEALIRIARGFADQAHSAERDLFQIRQSFEQYNLSLLEAENNLALSEGDIALESLNIELGEADLRLAEWQSRQVAHSVAHYDGLIKGGWSDVEKLAFGLLIAAGTFQSVGAIIGAVGGIVAASAADWGTSGGILQGVGGIIGATGGLVLSGGGGLSTFSGAASMYASFERRAQEWQFQFEQGQFGLQIAGMNVAQAVRRLEIAHRRRQIAVMKRQFAADAVRFLGRKFLNREMWMWLQRTIRDQYRTRLNYAITAGYMAERALAFELQNRALRLVRFNYFNPSRDGLLGATQLQSDLSGLEHARLSMAMQKLQLTRTLSLARLFPIEFEQFRLGKGSLHFSTAVGTINTDNPEDAYSLELFDRDFPGHYMRLIKSVKVTVIALIPPHDGIKASLRNSGLSRVVVGPPYQDEFREVTVKRYPESVGLSSPYQSNGLFVLDYRDDLLLPFEGMGVATDWIFELPKASNAFDFRTIADVLISIEYTALESSDYRRQIIQKLDRRISADRPFSFRHQFADAWYDLHHPDQVQEPEKPMTVSFKTRREDFPPNVSEPGIDHVTLYIARKPGITYEFKLELKFAMEGSSGSIGGQAVTVNGIAGTRQDNAAAWAGIIGKSPEGEWTLSFENNNEIRELLENNQIEDILFVITYSAVTPDWPEPD